MSRRGLSEHLAANYMAALFLAMAPTAATPAPIPEPVSSLFVEPAKPRPKRGASRDRSLPGKARRRSRRAA